MGRETFFFDYDANRSDGELLRQTWIDSETPIVLRMKQQRISTMAGTTKRVLECQNIDFEPVSADEFSVESVNQIRAP